MGAGRGAVLLLSLAKPLAMVGSGGVDDGRRTAVRRPDGVSDYSFRPVVAAMIGSAPDCDSIRPTLMPSENRRMDLAGRSSLLKGGDHAFAGSV